MLKELEGFPAPACPGSRQAEGTVLAGHLAGSGRASGSCQGLCCCVWVLVDALGTAAPSTVAWDQSGCETPLLELS